MSSIARIGDRDVTNVNRLSPDEATGRRNIVTSSDPLRRRGLRNTAYLTARSALFSSGLSFWTLRDSLELQPDLRQDEDPPCSPSVCLKRQENGVSRRLSITSGNRTRIHAGMGCNNGTVSTCSAGYSGRTHSVRPPSVAQTGIHGHSLHIRP